MNFCVSESPEIECKIWHVRVFEVFFFPLEKRGSNLKLLKCKSSDHTIPPDTPASQLLVLAARLLHRAPL